jgi:hypothetical protein
MEKYWKMFLGILAFVWDPIHNFASYLLAEIGPWAWIVIILLPVVTFLSISSLLKTRTR